MDDFFQIVGLRARPGREDELRGHLVALVEPSRRDEGNMQFELLSDPQDPRRFVFVEHWANAEAQLKHHTQAEHILRFEKDRKEQLVEAVEFFYRLERVV